MSRTRSQQGSMLIFVLFLTGLLGVLAAIAGTVMKSAADSSRSFAQRIRADEAMRGAIEYIVGQTGDDLKQAFGTALVQVGGARVALTVRDEAARIDLNKAPAPLLAGIFRQAGVAPDEANAYAARIVDWRDTDDKVSPNGGAERPAYRSAGRVDGPRNGPFTHVGELALILGMPARVAAAVSPYVTVGSGLDKVNPRFADPPVLLAIPGTSEQSVRNFIAERSRTGTAPKTLISTLGQVQDFVTEESGFAVSFEGRVEIVPDMVRNFEAIVSVVPGDNEPFRIFAWNPDPPGRLRNLP